MKKLGLLVCLLAAAVLAQQVGVEKRSGEEALREVDSLLKKVSDLTGLPIKQPVRSAVASKAEIEKYLRARMKEVVTPEKLKAQELALKEFGLLPAEFGLEEFTVDLLTEQAAAYYDPKQNMFFIADWTPAALQRPAIVHELTHALQDQQIDLDKFLTGTGLNQDELTARSAVVEGGGVLAMLDFMMAEAGVKMRAAGVNEILAQATAAEMQKFPVFSAAPLYLRESLLFPYTSGMQYMTHLVEKHGKGAYAEALKSPPRTTAEILHPDRAPVATPPEIKLPDVKLPAGYKQLDDDVLGEFDVLVLLRVHAGEETAQKLAPAWRGFRYALYGSGTPESAFLVHRSRWSDAASAKAFAAAMRKALEKKGAKSARVDVVSNTVTVIEGPPM